MRVLILSDASFACGIVPHMEYEGHSVTVTSTNPTSSATYTIAISDSPSFTQTMDKLQKQGVRVMGVSNWSSLIDSNEGYRNNLIRAIGYKQAVPDTKGERVIVTTWFNGNDFLVKFLVFNYRHMLTGDLGVKIPSSGYAAYFNVDNTKLVKEVLTPLEKFLRKAGHQGAFCVECICNEEGIYVSDISASIHNPYPHLIFENAPYSKTSILNAVMDERSKPFKVQSNWAAGVMLSVYPYPYAAPDKPVVIHGLSQANIKHSWLMDLAKVEGEWLCGSRTGCLGYMVARGDTCVEATRRIYRTLRQHISGESLQYRLDIGKDISYRCERLRQLNLLKEV